MYNNQVRKLLVFLLSLGLFLTVLPSKAVAAIECEWSVNNNNKLSFCGGGFESEAEARDHFFNFRCTGNCGGSGFLGWLDSIFGGDDAPIINVAPDGSGAFYSCMEVDAYSQDIENAIENCMKPSTLEKIELAGCGRVDTVGEIAWQLTGAGAIVNISKIPSCIVEAHATNIYNKSLEECLPTITGSVRPNNLQTSCAERLDVSTNLETVAAQTSQKLPFGLCEQIGENNPEALKRCNECVGDSEDPQGVWTAIGCVPTEPGGIIQTIITLALSIGGGITLLLILAGAFRLSVSAGDPKQAEEAREQITSAVIGLIFIIISVAMLRFIGVSFLQIPGFGG